MVKVTVVKVIVVKIIVVKVIVVKIIVGKVTMVKTIVVKVIVVKVIVVKVTVVKVIVVKVIVVKVIVVLILRQHRNTMLGQAISGLIKSAGLIPMVALKAGYDCTCKPEEASDLFAGEAGYEDKVSVVFSSLHYFPGRQWEDTAGAVNHRDERS